MCEQFQIRENIFKKKNSFNKLKCFKYFLWDCVELKLWLTGRCCTLIVQQLYSDNEVDLGHSSLQLNVNNILKEHLNRPGLQVTQKRL